MTKDRESEFSDEEIPPTKPYEQASIPKPTRLSTPQHNPITKSPAPSSTDGEKEDTVLRNERTQTPTTNHPRINST